jgi:hypothetical protein
MIVFIGNSSASPRNFVCIASVSPVVFILQCQRFSEKKQNICARHELIGDYEPRGTTENLLGDTLMLLQTILGKTLNTCQTLLETRRVLLRVLLGETLTLLLDILGDMLIT